MQTEYARQQQLITVGMLALLLGPLTLVAAGVLAGVVGRNPRRMVACAVVGLLALAGAGWFWRDYQRLALEAWAIGSEVYRTIQTRQSQRMAPDYWRLTQQCWPPIWTWWQWSLPIAPLAALNLLSNRVRSAEEIEQERFDKEERAAAERAPGPGGHCQGAGQRGRGDRARRVARRGRPALDEGRVLHLSG